MTEDQQLKEHLWQGSNVFTVIISGSSRSRHPYFDDKAGDIPISRVFKHKGHNPFSGNLHYYECSQCKRIILVDPMDVLGIVGYEILTDVREKPRGKSFFEWFFHSQEEHHDIEYEGPGGRQVSRGKG